MPVKGERKINLSISYKIWTGNHKFEHLFLRMVHVS